MVEVQEIYCPRCGEDFRLAYSAGKEQLFVVCDCDGARTLDAFIKEFGEEVDAGGKNGATRMFQ